MKTINCPNCECEMYPGRRRDLRGLSEASQETWLPGKPKKEILGIFSGYGTPIPVTTSACPQCGLLQSYIDIDEVKK